MSDITVDASIEQTPKRSTAFLSGIAQACAFLAAPLLTASCGLSIAKVFGLNTLTASPAVLVGLFVAGAAFAGASIATNYMVNSIRQHEQSDVLEKTVEKVLVKNHPEIAVNQEVAFEQKTKSWAAQVTASRDAVVNPLQR